MAIKTDKCGVPTRNAGGRPSLVPRVIADVRHYIGEHALLQGDRLPAEPDFASMLDVSRMTLRKAMGQLVDEGLLERKPGAGTVLTRAWSRTVGVVFSRRMLDAPERGFSRWTINEARHWLESHGIAMRMLMCDDDGQLDPEAVVAIQGHAVDGVLLRHSRGRRQTCRRLSAAGIPVVGLMAYPEDPGTEYWVSVDPGQGQEFIALARRGHKRAALAGSAFREYGYPQEHAMELGRRCSISIDVETLTRLPQQDSYDFTTEGRELAETWWALPDPPQALVFNNHYICRGFQYQLIENGLAAADMPDMSVGEAREFVLDLPCPVIRIQREFTPVVHQACEMLVRLLQGLPVNPKDVVIGTRWREVTGALPKPSDRKKELATASASPWRYPEPQWSLFGKENRPLPNAQPETISKLSYRTVPNKHPCKQHTGATT